MRFPIVADVHDIVQQLSGVSFGFSASRLPAPVDHRLQERSGERWLVR
jgi:hypothetical protein